MVLIRDISKCLEVLFALETVQSISSSSFLARRTFSIVTHCFDLHRRSIARLWCCILRLLSLSALYLSHQDA